MTEPRTTLISPRFAAKSDDATTLVITGQQPDGSGKFCVGVVISHGIVTRAAPMVRYMQSWPVSKVKGYCTLRGWLCEEQ